MVHLHRGGITWGLGFGFRSKTMVHLHRAGVRNYESSPLWWVCFLLRRNFLLCSILSPWR
jgi:hypothetical protein